MAVSIGDFTISGPPRPPRIPFWRRRPRRPTYVVGALLLVATLVPYPVLAGGVDATDTIVLPESIGAYNLLTTAVEDEAPGVVLLEYHSGNMELYDGTYQNLTLAADGHTYRQLEASRGKSRLLAPDGTAMLLSERMVQARAFTFVDLRTGDTHEFPLPEPAGVLPLGWSPDRRYVAYTFDENSLPSVGSLVDVTPGSRLAILDLTTGVSTAYPALGRVVAGAFSPDSRELAIQVGQKAIVIDTTGRPLRELHLADNMGLLPRVAWSPDGRRIATVTYTVAYEVPLPLVYPRFNGGGPPQVSFVDASGGLAAGPLVTGSHTVLGWRSDNSLVELKFPGTHMEDGAELIEVSVTDGTTHRIAQFANPRVCEYFMSPCRAEYDMHAATSLLPRMQVRPNPSPWWWPDRGLLQLRLYLYALILLAALAVAVATRVISHSRERASAAHGQ
jgi:hypothetical protein